MTPTPPPEQAPAEKMAISRREFYRLIFCLMLVAAALATIGGAVAFQKIGILEEDLADRRRLRDHQQAETQRQQAETERKQVESRKAVCIVLRHLVDPDAPDIAELRNRSQCPATTAPSAPAGSPAG